MLSDREIEILSDLADRIMANDITPDEMAEAISILNRVRVDMIAESYKESFRD